jgi:aspartate ammonia-lyase
LNAYKIYNNFMPKYYGQQTEKAIKNFPFGTHKWHKEFIMALAQIKKAAAVANFDAGNISRDVKNAIVRAADEVLEGLSTSLKTGKMHDQFPLPALMGGAGTSIHMNMNEVLASRAMEILSPSAKATGDLREKRIVHPNDHVNRSQSTNDVNPSAIKVAAVLLLNNLAVVLDSLAAAFEKKSMQFKNVIKLARTHLQDAVPITLGEEFGSYAEVIRQHKKEIERVTQLALVLNLGGTAAGNSVNASPKYIRAVYKHLNKITGQKFKLGKNLISLTNSQGYFVIISQAVTALCLDASKIASDLRLMSSGPRGGLGEISLQELQNGSSIMPGKNNPVMPETVNNMYYWVSGNNLSIEHAAHGAQLDLAVMIPTIADKLIESIKISAQVLEQFNKRCVASIKANPKRCRELLEKSTAYASLLTPKLGYEKMSEVVKEAVRAKKTLREVIVSQKLLSNKEFDAVVKSFR